LVISIIIIQFKRFPKIQFERFPKIRFQRFRKHNSEWNLLTPNPNFFGTHFGSIEIKSASGFGRGNEVLR
jgi:hypothetical protein